MPISTENQIKVINPATGEEILTMPVSSKQEITEKFQLAKESFSIWSSFSLEKRIGYLKRIFELIIDDRKNIAETITRSNGKPLAESYLTEIASTLQVIEYFIKNGVELLSDKKIALGNLYPTKKSSISYEPYGVIAIIEPWNYPFYLPVSAIVKTLLSGNTFIFKPAGIVSLVGKLIEEILQKSELPPGVANVIFGDSEAAEILLELPLDKVIFTGSVEVGRKIAEKCAKKFLPVSLELGGKVPAIVLKSTNIDYAAEGILWGAISNCGQACASIERVYVESKIHDEFTEKIVSLAKNLRIGNGLDTDTDVGPLASKNQLEKIEEHIFDAENKGAKILAGGKRIQGSGFFFEPTILTNVNHSMKVMTEETFGPVIPIMKFETIEEAVQLANNSNYALASSIWTGESENARSIAQKLNCGTIWVNDSLFLQAHPACPWQGYKESGYGGSSIYDFVRSKHISIDQGFIPTLKPKYFWWYPYKGKARSYHDLLEVVFKPNIKGKIRAAFNTLIDFLN